MNLRLDIAYDGGPFRGFARQPDQRTVQGDLEEALARVAGRDVETFCAGRTDAGVHALGQVVSIPAAPDDLDPDRVVRALNGLCGPAIAVHAAREMPEGWHARFSARSRLYCYAILQASPDPFLTATTLHHPEPLDLDAMAEAAGHLVGTHDFSSFGRLPDPDASAIRNLYELKVWREGSLIKVRARANAFIQQMVRSLVGLLLYVGEGRRSPDDVPAILAARDRAAAGPVAPPHGLCLVAVEYDEGWSHPPDSSPVSGRLSTSSFPGN
ncbi:MAG: tRNA pseudouridine(38-40) synthase TruA [Actinomycetota bacterium]